MLVRTVPSQSKQQGKRWHVTRRQAAWQPRPTGRALLKRVPNEASAPPHVGFVADVMKAGRPPTDRWTDTSSFARQANRKKWEEDVNQLKKEYPTKSRPKTYSAFVVKPTPGQRPPEPAAFGNEYFVKQWTYQWAPENQVLPSFNPGARSVIVHGRPVQVRRFRAIMG